MAQCRKAKLFSMVSRAALLFKSLLTSYLSVPKDTPLKRSLGLLFNLGVYKLWIWISFLSFVPWHSFWWELKNSAIYKFSLSNIILARYMKISYMYVMWNSAEKGQILKKLSREGPPGTRTLYSPLFFSKKHLHIHNKGF